MGITIKKNNVNVDGEDYEIIRPEAVTASKYVVDMWLKLGKPKDPFSDSGKKLVELMIVVWEYCYPFEAREWYEARKEYQGAELSIQEQVKKKTGRSLASYPYPIYAMLTAVFKGFDPAQRENCIKMVKNWPMFRFANRV